MVGSPAVGEHVDLPAGTYRLGDAGAEREVDLCGVRIGRFPVVNADLARFVTATGRAVGPTLERKLDDPQLADHPATDVTYDDAATYCAWAGGRLPTGDEWEAAARGPDARPWPWGATFDPEKCACVEAGWGWTAPVSTHPHHTPNLSEFAAVILLRCLRSFAGLVVPKRGGASAPLVFNYE